MQNLIDFLSQPWPWYIAGPLIGLIIITLQWLDNKPLAASSSYRHICAATFPSNVDFLKYDWKSYSWNLIFVLGIFIGGIISATVLSHPATIAISADTSQQLSDLGITDQTGFAPAQLFSWSSLQTVTGFLIVVVGGFFIGFGSRYAGGCVSGHSMSGISDLQWTSLVTTICIFAGGIITSNIILPLILKISL